MFTQRSYQSRKIHKRCVDEDIYVSDLGCGIYNDARGQQFLREQRYVYINPMVHDSSPYLRPYSPDYDSEFVVTPPRPEE